MRVTFLGTGTSHGIPVIGCGCAVCSSGDPRDNRFRSSILVEEDGIAILVDAGPEFRLQALRARMTRLDAVLVTHAHADHVHGLDDIRPLARDRPMPVHADAPAVAELRERFAYAFRGGQEGGGKPRIELHVVSGKPIRIGSLEVLPLPLLHGELSVTGWRFGSFAYLTDCSAIPEDTWPLLAGVRVAALDALRFRPHATHLSIDGAIETARRAGFERTWLTHICHDASHADIEAHCRERGVEVGAAPAWDGLSLELPS